MASAHTSPGRILSIDDARKEAAGVDLPFAPPRSKPQNEADPEAMSYLPGHAYGIPTSDLAAVIPVDDPAHPNTLADFVWLLVTVRQGGKLIDRSEASHTKRLEGLLSRWLLWGALNESPDRALVVASLSIAPARPADEPDAAMRGVTTELLRLVSPSAIASRAVERLRQYGYRRRSGQPLHPILARSLERLDAIRTVAAATPEIQIEQIARRSVQLVRAGITRPNPIIAREFGLTASQVRDRVRRARELDYLPPGTPGRASGEPGPRLLSGSDGN